MAMSQLIAKTILSNFENEKQLTEDNVALIIAAKKRIYNKRKKNLNIFVIHHEEYLDFYFLIDKLIHNLSSSVFQFLIKTSGSSDAPEGHWGFGECAWCATTQELKIFIADPLGLFHSEDILLDMQKSGFNFEELSKKVNLTVYLGYDKIQFSNNDCFYISLDAAFMLVKQYYFESLYQPNPSLKDFFIKNCELDLPFKFKIEILELPYRLLRITQSIKSINEKLEKKPLLKSVRRNTSQSDQTAKSFLLTLLKSVWRCVCCTLRHPAPP